VTISLREVLELVQLTLQIRTVYQLCYVSKIACSAVCVVPERPVGAHNTPVSDTLQLDRSQPTHISNRERSLGFTKAMCRFKHVRHTDCLHEGESFEEGCWRGEGAPHTCPLKTTQGARQEGGRCPSCEAQGQSNWRMTQDTETNAMLKEQWASRRNGTGIGPESSADL